MGSKGLKNFPYRFETLVFVKGYIGLNIRWYNYRDDYIAVFFAFCNPHHPSDRLYHLYLRISRRKEHDCIQRRDIYSFTEATDIR